MTTQGVWDMQDVRDKLLAGANWEYDTEMWIWGYNGYGGLGLNDKTHRSSPTQLPGTGWALPSKKFAQGKGYAAAVKENGSLWTWGDNGSGQLGQGNKTRYSSPTQVGTDNDWSTVSAGYHFTYAVKQDGTAWTWGTNGQGQLGQNDTTGYSSPKQLGTGTSWSWGECGMYTGYLITGGGSARGMGAASEGRLGNNANTSRSSPIGIPGGGWTSITSTSSNSFGVAGGSLYTWGKGHWGQNGKNNQSNYSTPQFIFGSAGDYNAVSGGEDKSVVIKSDGTLWAMGDGASELGLNDTTSRSSPTQIGNPGETAWKTLNRGVYDSQTATAGIKTDGSLWGWGLNSYGGLGMNNRSQYNSPRQVGTDTDWFDVNSGPFEGIATKKSY